MPRPGKIAQTSAGPPSLPISDPSRFPVSVYQYRTRPAFPLGEGAAKIAASQNIVTVQLNREANQYEYVLRFLKDVMIGVRCQIKATATVEKGTRESPTRVVPELEDRIELEQDE